MENKSNSLSRVKRHQREKVLRFSIRKYSFGAASVAVAALMFLGARVASADSVIENHSQPTTDVVNQKEKDKPLAEIQQPTDIKVEVAQNPSEKKMTTNNEIIFKVVDKAKLKKVVEELKTTLSSKSDLDKSVISPIKDRVQKGQALLDSDTATQKDVDELLSLLESDLTVLSNATKESSTVQETATENKTEIKDNKTASELSEADKTISDKKESLKLSAEELQAAVLELPEHESTKEVFEKANELLGLAQGVIQNTTISLNDVEDVTKRVKRMFNSVKNATTRLTSGARDSRNGNKIEEGTNVRAASISPTWDSSDNLLIYQRHRASDGSRVVRNGLREYTEKKVDMFAKTTTIKGERYVVYDVFFNNDGASMAHLSRYQIYRLILPPQILDLTSEGLYKGNTLRDLKFETYTRNGNSGTLSQNPENFTRTASHNVNFLNNSTDYGSGWRKLTYFNALDIRHNRSYNQDMSETFKGNSNDPLLIHAVTRTESKFNQYSYGFGVKTEDRDSAIHMQVKAKLKAGVTDDQVREAFALAVAGTFGKTTNQAYTFVSGKDASEPKYTDYPDQPVQPTLREKQAKLYPIQGSRHTKVVGDTIPNTGNPVADRYITRKGSGDFPAGMNWSWEGNNAPSTANAGKFTYTAIARYQDGSTSKDANSGSDGRVHFTVNPKKPTITTSVVNKKGLTNQTIEVNVGSGVKNGSVVKLYDGDRVIGQGTSNGTTARITVSGALPGNPLKAETTVDNGGVVVSEKSDPVTPTEAPDTQAPTITAGDATVTSREQITPISVTAVDNTGGVGMRDNNPIEVTGLPAGLTYANNRITGTPTGAPGNSTVTIKAYDKNGNMATKTITITVRSQADVHNPTGAGLTVNQNHTITDAELKAKVSNAGPGTLSIVSRPSTATAGNAGNAVVKVTYPDGTFDNVNVPVTVTDVTGPTITAESATVTKNESITPIPVTAVDNTGGVGMRDNNPIEVTNLPAGLTYANNQITGTPTAGVGYYTVTIKAYDKNNRLTTKQIRITVRSQADAHNPTGAGLTVNQNHTITYAELKAKVNNFAPGTLSIVSKPSTATAGNAGNAVVKVTYPDGTFDNVNVPVTVTDVTGPTITADSATVTKNESITPIPVTAVDNTGGVGMRDNNPIEVTNLPAGLRYANNQITGTPTAGVGYYTVTIKAYDKNNRSTTKQIRITVQDQASKYTPTGETLTVPYNHNITDDEVKAKVQNFAPGNLTVQSKPSTNTSGNVGNAVVKVTYPDGSHDTVNVPVVVGRPNKDDYTPKYNDGSGKPGSSVEIPVSEANGKKIPTGTTYTSGTPGIITVDKTTGKVTVTIPSDKNPGDKVTGKVLVRYPDGSTEEVPVTVTVVNRDKDDYTPKYNDGSGKPGSSVEIPVSEANGKKIPTGTTYTSGTPGIITVDKTTGKVTVAIPSDKNPGDKVTGKVLVRYPDGSEEEVPVTVTVVNRDKDNYTPKYNDGSGKPGSSVEIPVSEANGKKIPTGTTYTSGTPGIITVDKTTGKVTVTIPSDKNPGDKVTGKVLVRYPDGSEEEVPVTVTVVNRDKDDYTPKYNDGSGKPGSSVEIPVSEANGKKIPTGTTYTSGTPGIITVDKTTGKVTVTIPADKNPGDKVTGKVLVRYPDGSEEEVPVTVTVVNRDKDDYTPKYNDGSGKPGSSVEIPVSEANGKKIPTGTTYTSGTPGIITVDKTTGKVTVTIPSDKNPGDKVTGKVLVRYPDGSEEEVPVTVTVVNRDKDDYTPKYNDGSGKPGSSVEIPVSEANGKKIPTGTTYTSGTPGIITVDKTTGKVTVTIPSDKNPGDKVTGKVLVRYPDGSEEEVPVTVTVVNRDKDDYTPKYNDGSGKPGSSVEIPVSEANGKKIPTGTTYTSGTPGIITVDKTTGKVTVTIPSDKNPGDKVTGKVLVRYPDGSEEEVPVTVTVVNRDKDDYTPKYNDGSGKPGSSVEIPVSEANGKKIPTGTTYTSGTPGIITVDKTTGKVTVTIPSDKNPGDKVTGKVLVRYPDGSEEEVPVTVTVVNRDKDDYTPKYNDGSGKPGSSVEIPVSEANGKKIPTGTTYTSSTPGIITVDKTTGKVTVTIPSDKNPGDKVTGKVLVRYPDGSEEEVPVTVTVVNRDKDDYTPKYNDGSGKPGSSVEIPVSEANGKKIPTGTTYTSGTPGIITVDKTTGKVTVTIPSDKNPGDKVTGKVLVRYPDGSEEEVPVTVTVVNRDKDDYTPKYNDGSGKPGSSVEIPVSEANGKKIPTGTTYTSSTPGIITVDKTTGKVTVTIPSDKNPGDKVTGKVLVRYPDGSTEEVPVTVTVTPPEKLTPTVDVEQDPKTGDVTVTPKKPDGSTYPPGTKVEIPGKDGNPITVTIGEDGKGKVPNSELPDGKVPGTGKITEPGKPAVEVPVETPAKVTPETPVTEKPGKIEITQQPNGNAIVTPKKPDGSTYPPGTKVEIPGEDGNTITVTIGDDGSGEVPNDNLPKTDIPGTGTVTEPNKKPSQPVDVTTPARKTPTVDVEQDPKTGDVTVTPKKPDGSTYPPGTKVEIPGKDGNPITVTIGEDGKGKVPNSELPDGKVPGTGKITEPGKPAVEVPVETPAKVTPETPVTEKPGKIEITQQPNGNAIVTPKKPDGSTYPPGTKVEIPGEDGNTITVTIGDDGSGEVPNDNLPKTDIPGTGTVTEPNKKPSQPVDVTTPARKTPTVDVEQDPKTGDVTVTPKKPDGSTYPPGTKVEIPGKDGNPITVTIGEDGKGKVPNSELPDGKVPGTSKITEPGKPAVEVPVTTPGKVTPATPTTETPSEIEITRKPNGDAVVTPKKPDGSTYPSGSKVVIPGENNTPIEVTIGDNGSGEVPNDKLPKKDVPGKGTVTEPNKKPSQPVDVTTPAQKTPTVDVEQDPKTGDVTVTPKKPDGSTFPPGTKVEIPGKDGNPITVEIGQDGKGKVPNDKLPKKDVPGTGKITEPGKPAVEVPNVTTPAKVTPATPETEKPGKIEITQQPNGNAIVTPKKPDGSTYPPGTKVEIPGEDGNTITVTIGDDGSGEVPNDNLPKTDIPGTGTVTEPNKKPSQPVDVTTPARKTPTVDVEQDPKTGDVTVTPKKPDGSTYPPGTKVEIPGKDGNPITVTIGEDGKGKVPNSELPDGKVPGTSKITEPGKPAVEVPVTTPGKVTPATPTTETPSEIEITRKPNGDAVVTPKKPDGSTYPSGSKVVIPGENNTPIEVTIGDNGSGEVPNDKLPKKDVPGKGTVTEPNKKPSQPVDVTTPAQKTPTVDVEQDPKTGDVTVTPKKPDGSTFPPGTKVEIPGKDGNPITVEIGQDGKGKVPNDKLPKKDVPGTGKITEPGKPAVEVPNVTTPAKVTPATPETEKPGKIEITQQPNGNAIVTPKKPDGSTYPSKTTVEIPGENGTTITVTIGDNGSGEVPNDNLPKTNVSGTGKVTEPNKKPSQPVDVTTPARKTPTVELKPDPKTGDVTVTPKKPDGSTFPPGTKVEIPGEDGPITVEIGQDGKGKVPNDKLPKKDVPGTGKITEPGKPAVEVPNVTTPAKVTPATPETEKPGKIEITQQPNGNAIVTPKKPDGSTYPPGTKVEIPGEDGNTITVTIGDDGSGEVPNDNLPKTDIPGTGTVTEPNKKPSQPVDVTTPARKTPTVDVEQDPKTGDVTVTPKKPDGSTYPPGTKVEIPGKDGNPITVTIGEDGKGKVPNSELPDGKVPGTSKITEPGKPAVEVPVTTPGKVTPATPTTETPSEIEITRKPNGDAVVTPKKPDGSTYPSGSKVVIPGENNTPIEVTIGDNGSGEVPNDKLPKKDVPGKGTVTEPNKKPSQPVDVTTPAQKTPTVDVEQDPKTGDVTVTPKKPDGSTFPPGTKVEIPGKDGNPITVEIGQDGKGKVPNDKLPKKDVPGTGKITEPGKPAVEVPNVTTPAKVTPATPETEKPGKIEITQQPNGNAIVTPKKPDGSTYPPGTKVEIPGEDGNTITVTIGDDGSGEVPNDNLPKTDIPGTGTVTEPNKKPSQPVDVTTPARKTPTVDVEQDPKTGDVTVTPKKPDGSTYPPGTKVEIPGKDGNPITVTIGEDGKGKVPNSELPDGKVPGTGKITEPGKPAVEVPVTTPGKVIAENGELPGPITLPELTIEVRWIDEDGNVLKPSVKTGNEKNAEHGTIPGYEFVRTMIDENEPVMTHIFRKVGSNTNTIPVAPVTPAPSPTTPVPDAVTPNADQVDTKTTMDNGDKSNDSQNVLPNTGTESNATLASLGLLGMLGGLGLVARKKKED